MMLTFCNLDLIFKKFNKFKNICLKSMIDVIAELISGFCFFLFIILYL